MRDALLSAGIDAGSVRTFDDVQRAFLAAREAAGEADRIVVFGSFLTVAAPLAAAQ
jgi:dihydrofolate synthase/folylpolyglutamate synthase